VFFSCIRLSGRMSFHSVPTHVPGFVTPQGLQPSETIQRTDRQHMSLALQLKDYRLTTAEILYYLPDHPGLLQTYVWQDMDMAPEYPVLRKFLDFWNRELDGKLHSVRVASAKLVKPPRYRHPGAWLRLH
jgi:uncharacterized protein Usg